MEIEHHVVKSTREIPGFKLGDKCVRCKQRVIKKNLAMVVRSTELDKSYPLCVKCFGDFLDTLTPEEATLFLLHLRLKGEISVLKDKIKTLEAA